MKYALGSLLAVLLLVVGAMGSYIALSANNEATVNALPTTPCAITVPIPVVAPVVAPAPIEDSIISVPLHPVLNELQPINLNSATTFYDVEFVKSMDSIEDQLKFVDARAVVKKASFKNMAEDDWYFFKTGFGGYVILIDIWIRTGRDAKIYLGAIRYEALDNGEEDAVKLSGFLTSQGITTLKGDIETENNGAIHLNKVIEEYQPTT